jgi:hypothetical protein
MEFPLHETDGAGFTKEAMAFIAAGVGINKRDNGGETFLHWAAKPKPRWDVHLGGIGNGAGSLAAAFQPLIAGRCGSGV